MLVNDKRINALIIIDSLGIGGAEVSLKTMSKAMVDMGHNVVVLVIRSEIILDLDERVSVEILGYKKYRYLPSTYVNAMRMNKFVRNLEAKYGRFQLKIANLTLSHKLAHLSGLSDVYYCIHENIIASNLVNRTGIKRYARESRIRRLYNNKDIICVSDGVKDSLKVIQGLHYRSVKTIYNAIDMEVINNLSEECNPYRKIQYIVHVGRFSVRQKRHDILLAAYKKLCPDYKLVLVGDGADRSCIVNKIHQMKLENRVILEGFSNNPYPIIRGATLLILSSDYEGFGVVLAEALCLDTAVVSTDCESGPSEIMVSSLSDYLVKTGDADALAIKMKKAIVDVENDQYPFESAAIERFLPAIVARQYIDLAN